MLNGLNMSGSKKPVVFESANLGKKHKQDDLAQRLILKAISEGITDISDLKKIVGLRSATDVYRTMDKMALRKEYHQALGRAGIDFDYLVAGVKNICDNGSSDKVRLSAFQILLKSLGLDKYMDDGPSIKSWEDTIIELTDKNNQIKQLEESQNQGSKNLLSIDSLIADSSSADSSSNDSSSADSSKEYEVKIPVMPEDERKQREEEKALADSFYE